MTRPTVARLSLAVLLSGAGCQLGGDEWDDDVGRSQHALDYLQPGKSTLSNVNQFSNRCATNPEEDIRSNLISDPEYIMAYRSGEHDQPSTCNGNVECDGAVAAPYYEEQEESPNYHRQSIQRIHRNMTNYLLVSHNVKPFGSGEDETCWHPGFEVIHMDNDAHGSGFLNLGDGGVTPTEPALCEDHIVTYWGQDDVVRRHAGGMQVSGDYLVVAFEDPAHEDPAAFRIYNLADPPNPSEVVTVERVDEEGDVTQGSSAALTRTNDGKFMVMIFGEDADDVEVFVSAGTTMPSTEGDWISKGSFDFPGSDTQDFQNVQFVTRCDDGEPEPDVSGELFLVATFKTSPVPFDMDFVVLYQVTFPDVQPQTYEPTFTPDAEAPRVMTCSSEENTGGDRYCDFDAGAGVFVDGNGDLMLYGVEHWNDHFDNSDDAVKVREFSTH